MSSISAVRSARRLVGGLLSRLDLGALVVVLVGLAGDRAQRDQRDAHDGGDQTSQSASHAHTLVYRLKETRDEIVARPMAMTSRIGATVHTASVPMYRTKPTDPASQSSTR